MRKLVGIIGVLLALTACGQTNDLRRPEPQLAPITNMSGAIPAEAGQYGLLAISAYATAETQHYSRPAVPFQFEPDGSFSVELPTTFDNDLVWAEIGECDLAGTALLGYVAAASEPFVDNAVTLTALRTAYRLEAPDGTLAFAWYSPDDRRVLCELLDDRMTGSDHLTIDLRLVAGWNEVAYTLDGGRGLFRSGRVPDAEWRAFLE